MASNLEYLEGKLIESKNLANQYKTNANASGLLIESLNKELQNEMFYYSSLGALNVTKKKNSESKQASLKTQIAKAKSDYDYWINKYNQQNKVTQDIQLKIDAFLQAVNEGTSTGLKAEDALEFANQAVQSDINQMQADEQTKAESENAKQQNKMLNYILVGIAIAIVVGIIYYFVKKRQNK